MPLSIWHFATHYGWYMDAWTPLGVVIILVSLLIGLAAAWSPRAVLLRLRRRVADLEEAVLSTRNKVASRARWDKPDEADALLQAMALKKKEPVLDNEYTPWDGR